MFQTVFEIIAVMTGFVAMYFISKIRLMPGFIIMIISQMFWVVFGCFSSAYFLAVQSIIFIFMNFKGILELRKQKNERV